MYPTFSRSASFRSRTPACKEVASACSRFQVPTFTAFILLERHTQLNGSYQSRPPVCSIAPSSLIKKSNSGRGDARVVAGRELSGPERLGGETARGRCAPSVCGHHLLVVFCVGTGQPLGERNRLEAYLASPISVASAECSNQASAPSAYSPRTRISTAARSGYHPA